MMKAFNVILGMMLGGAVSMVVLGWAILKLAEW